MEAETSLVEQFYSAGFEELHVDAVVQVAVRIQFVEPNLDGMTVGHGGDANSRPRRAPVPSGAMTESPPFAAGLFSECFEAATSLGGTGWDEVLPVLLVPGADSHCTRWMPALIEPLQALGHRVVRYDHRDSGLSSKVPSDVGYTLDDLADDALAVMEAHGVERAHVIGRSMGGMVGQVLALHHADRVATLTLACSTPGLGDERLPVAADWLLERMTERLFTGPPSGEADRAAWIVEQDEWFAGPRYAVSTASRLVIAVSEVARCWYPESGHGAAVGGLAFPAGPSRGDPGSHACGARHGRSRVQRGACSGARQRDPGG